jgi:tRNA1(Val) A37 N6-methylase TrmN6
MSCGSTTRVEIMHPDTVTADATVTDDAVLGGRLRLLQPRRGHRVGHDAILLAAAVTADPGEVAVDLGAGIGGAGLALAARLPGIRVRLVEIDPHLAGLAARNIARNGFSERAGVDVLDVEGQACDFAAVGLGAGSVGVVLMNPPFNDPARFAASPNAGRRAAHMGGAGSLRNWIATAARLLRSAGTLTLIHRADSCDEVLAALGEGFGDKSMLPIRPRPGSEAIRIIVRAVRGAPDALCVLPALDLQDAGGRPSAAAEEILRAARALTMCPDA